MKDSIVRSKRWQTKIRKFNNKHDVYHNYEYLKLYENSECDVEGYFSDSEDFSTLSKEKLKEVHILILKVHMVMVGR